MVVVVGGGGGGVEFGKIDWRRLKKKMMSGSMRKDDYDCCRNERVAIERGGK